MFLIGKSIYKKILGAFIFIILLTVLLSTTIEYLSTRSELPRLLTEIRTKNIAQILSSSYTGNKSWDMLKEDILRFNNWDTDTAEEKLLMRIIVKNAEGKTLYNSFADLTQRDNTPLIEGNSIQIYDYDSGKNVGTVTIYISRDFLERETGEYILGLLKPRILQGLITILIAIFVSTVLSRRITTPITNLTIATKGIAHKGDTHLIPVNTSDELGQMSEAFNQMIISLHKQRDLRRQLINDVSHDINTPLNVIRFEAKGLADKLTTSEEASKHIIEEIDTLSNLIHDLDWLAETDSGEFQLKMDSHSISEIVKTEIERWQLKAQISDTTLSLLPLPQDFPNITIDALRISQVLGNLLENSFKYTSPGGQIVVSCHPGKNEIIVSVSDSGSGIKAENLPYLFERFYRTDQSRERSKGGRGLGLAIVKQIVELHHGRVWVESEIDRGSLFSFSLPLR